jgi:hypothetical protein
MLLTAHLLLLTPLPLFQEPEAPVVEEVPVVVEQEPVINEVPMNQQPPETDIEAEALAAWLAQDGPEWDSPTGRFLRDMSVGMTIDMFAEFTEKEGSIEEFNDLRIRSAQLNFASPIYGTGHAFVTLDLADGGDGADFILREAGAWIEDFGGDFMPGRLDAQVGKYFADLGAFNTVMANEFAAPSLDGVRRSFLGGNLVMTGAELHHGMPIEDGYFRWSAGLAGDVESQDVDAFGNGVVDTSALAVGRRGFSNWAGTARATLQLNFGSGMAGRFGASAYYAPEQPIFTDLGGGSIERLDARTKMRGLDAGFRWDVPDSTASHEFSAELWLSDSEYRSGPGALDQDDSRGEWAMYEFVYNSNWSAGALFSRNDILGLAVQDDDAAYHSAFLTYSANENNHFSLFGTHTNPGYTLEKFFTIGAQWIFDLGAKRDNSIARWH